MNYSFIKVWIFMPIKRRGYFKVKWM